MTNIQPIYNHFTEVFLHLFHTKSCVYYTHSTYQFGLTFPGLYRQFCLKCVALELQYCIADFKRKKKKSTLFKRVSFIQQIVIEYFLCVMFKILYQKLLGDVSLKFCYKQYFLIINSIIMLLKNRIQFFLHAF